MKKHLYRLLTAAIISSSVFAGTYAWYTATEKSNLISNDEKPVAFVGTLTDEIQRRQASRLLWQIVKQGEALYDGEAIRTGSKGEVQILFAENNRHLDLEPESLIVIKRSAGEISLDLVEGSLFVAQAQENTTQTETSSTPAPTLVLKSKNGKIDLSKASASLSKESGKDLKIQVLEGSASVNDGTGALNELTQVESIKVLSPAAGKDLYLNADTPEKIAFKWQENKEFKKVSLYAGNSRRKLNKIDNLDPLKSEVTANLPFGNLYWKLVAETQKGQTVETPIYKNKVVARYSPTVVFPIADQHVAAEILPANMQFLFANVDQAKSVVLEVWTDAGLKNKLLTENVTETGTVNLANLKEGTYYYRASSYFADTEIPYTSKVQKFNISKKAPTFVNIEFVNLNEDKPFYFVEKPNIKIDWTSENNAVVSSWKLKIYPEGEDPATIQPVVLQTPKYDAPVPSKGRYIASIEAVNAYGESIGNKISSPLSVEPLPLLKAPEFTQKGTLQAQNDGTTQISWSEISGAKEYWIAIYRNNAEIKKIKYTRTASSLKNLLPGEYEIEMYAVDQYGRTGALSEKRKLIVPDSSSIKAPTLKKIQVN